MEVGSGSSVAYECWFKRELQGKSLHEDGF
jgi:hypothetical protein